MFPCTNKELLHYPNTIGKANINLNVSKSMGIFSLNLIHQNYSDTHYSFYTPHQNVSYLLTDTSHMGF